MTQRHKSAHHNLHNSSKINIYGKLLHLYASTLPAQSFFVLSSISFFGNLAIVHAETSIDNIVPTVESSQPAVVIPNPVTKDTVSSAPSRPQPQVNNSQAELIQKLRKPAASPTQQPASQAKPQVEVSQPRSNPTASQAKPQVEVSQPRSNPSASQAKPQVEVSQPRSNPSASQAKPQVEISQPRSNPSASQAKPQVEISQPRSNPSASQEQPKTEIAKPTAPRTLPENLPEVAQPGNNSNSTTAGKTRDYNNAYIDPTRYNSDTAATYQAPSSVVLTERSSGCQTVLPSGQSVSGNNCAQAPKQPNQRVANSGNQAAPNWLKSSQNAQVANVPQVRQVATTGNNTPRNNTSNNNTWRPQQTAAGSVTKTALRPNRFIPNPSDFATTTANASPIAPSGETLPPPMAAGNIAPRVSTVAYDFPLASVLPQIPFTGTLAYRGDGGMMFPLSIPARISSVFGWRTHPITGDRRFHAGTDLAAPMGTPVVAAARGQVNTAGWLGGYGLTAIVNHDSAQQTLYAHMSELFVQPGQVVEQGTVIGRVGSTGNSTGPHLHFEVRHLKPEGWVAVDSGVQLQVALSQLVEILQTAQLPQQPGS
ncbi:MULTISPECIES: peptidoglycan DD-metalloendopeptidase family protein [unclassified Anabaena]|uniref:peptidoglycan DD-metalloendopeptidase family protein n=1 Tax=unclassified Anabaena TaxID=2619674 RepID=UPI0039C6C3E5